MRRLSYIAGVFVISLAGRAYADAHGEMAAALIAQADTVPGPASLPIGAAPSPGGKQAAAGADMAKSRGQSEAHRAGAGAVAAHLAHQPQGQGAAAAAHAAQAASEAAAGQAQAARAKDRASHHHGKP